MWARFYIITIKRLNDQLVSEVVSIRKLYRSDGVSITQSCQSENYYAQYDNICPK